MKKYPSIAETILGFRNYEARALAAYRLCEWKDYDPFKEDSFTLYFSDQSALIDNVQKETITISDQKPMRREYEI